MKLFAPYVPLGLSHRIVMAPLTRVRGTETFCAPDTAVTYYTERSTPGGLIITEGSPVSPETQYEYAAGIYTRDQVEAWKKVTKSVHEKGGLISIQLWHLGRMAHGSWAENPFLKSLGRPLPSVSCSPTQAPGSSRNYKGERGVPYPPARELSNEEIRTRLVDDFIQATRNAKEAGFDMVEIHSAHGYLFDQFICSTTNLRTDEFGAQTIENRTRALGLVLNAVIKEMGSSQKVGIRFSPTNESFAYQGCKDATPEKTYREVISWVNQFNLGYLLISEPRWNGGRGNANLESDQTYNIPVQPGQWVKSVYDHFVIGSSSFSPESAEQALKDGKYDAIAFGRLFISNPDLVERIRNNKPLNLYDVNTFYIRDPVKGYIDYPAYEKAENFPKLESHKIGSKKPEPKL